MDFKHCEIRPGVVLRVEDNFGTIKASCIGIFSDEEDLNNLPPVYPFFKSSNNNFSSPKENDNIWVIFNRTNPLELFYIYQGPVKSSQNNILQNYGEDLDLIFSRKSGFSEASIYYSGETGININNDTSNIIIDKDKNINIEKDFPNRTIKIDNTAIHIGSGENEQPAVLGNELVDTLNTLISDFKKVKSAAQVSPYTFSLVQPLNELIINLQKNISKIKSTNVKIS